MIEVADLSVRLGRRLALDRVSVRIGKGDLVCLLGPNGAGKTTLLRAIAGLVPLRGALRIDGRDAASLSLAERARLVAYLPQGHVAHWPILAREAVAIGRMPHGATPSRLGDADRAAVARALEAVDAAALADRPITELSGGERARVMLARALAVEAPVLVADEPTAALDPGHQLAVMTLLAHQAARGTTVIASLHDLSLAARVFPRAIVLSDGIVRADGAIRDALGDAILSEVFGITAMRTQRDGVDVIVPWLTHADLRR